MDSLHYDLILMLHTANSRIDRLCIYRECNSDLIRATTTLAQSGINNCISFISLIMYNTI